MATRRQSPRSDSPGDGEDAEFLAMLADPEIHRQAGILTKMGKALQFAGPVLQAAQSVHGTVTRLRSEHAQLEAQIASEQETLAATRTQLQAIRDNVARMTTEAQATAEQAAQEAYTVKEGALAALLTRDKEANAQTIRQARGRLQSVEADIVTAQAEVTRLTQLTTELQTVRDTLLAEIKQG